MSCLGGAPTPERYYVTTDERGEREVTKAEFVAVERQAGFHNTMGQPDEPATSGFSNGRLSGRMGFLRGAGPESAHASRAGSVSPA